MIMKALNWILSFFDLKAVSNEPLLTYPITRPYTDIALSFMKWADTLQADGEWKAHQVFAKLLKKYPATPKNILRLEIELVYQQFFIKR